MRTSITSAVLTGEKVRIRPLESTDAEAAFALVHDRRPILRWLHWDGPNDPEELRAYYESWIHPGELGDDYHLAIVDRSTDELAGTIGLRFSGHAGTGDIGYWLGERFWGRGFATEAVGLIRHLAFSHLDAEALCAWVFLGNEASRVVLERNGFSFVRSVRGRSSTEGKGAEEWYFTILRSEWTRRRDSWSPMAEQVQRAVGN